MGLSPYGCMRMVAELLLGHHFRLSLVTLWMLPRSISGVLFHSSGPCGPPWVKKWGHGGVWVFGPHTPRVRRGGSYIGPGMPFRIIKIKLFSCGFLWHTLLNRCRPDLGTLKTTCHWLR